MSNRSRNGVAGRRRPASGQIDVVAVLQDRARRPAAGAAERRSRIGVGVLGAAVEDQPRVARARAQQPRPPPAGGPVRGVEQRGAVLGPRDPRDAVLGAQQLVRRLVDGASSASTRSRCAASRCGSPPSCASIHTTVAGRAAFHRCSRGPVGTPPMGTVSATGRRAISIASPSGVHTWIDRANRDAGTDRGERRLDPLDQQVAAVRGGCDPREQPGPADVRPASRRQRHGADLAREVVGEQRVVVRIAQQVLVGPDGRGAAAALAHERSAGGAGRLRRRAAGGHPEPAQDAAAVGQPGARLAPDGVERRARQRPRNAGADVDHPLLDAGVAQHGVREVASVGGEAHPGEGRAPGSDDARRLSLGIERLQRDRGDPGSATGRCCAGRCGSRPAGASAARDRRCPAWSAARSGRRRPGSDRRGRRASAGRRGCRRSAAAGSSTPRMPERVPAPPVRVPCPAAPAPAPFRPAPVRMVFVRGERPAPAFAPSARPGPAEPVAGPVFGPAPTAPGACAADSAASLSAAQTPMP